jgi:uncharacterized membrane protein YeiH
MTTLVLALDLAGTFGRDVLLLPAVRARFRTPVLILDAAGLAFFAVSGALKALAFCLTPVPAIIRGVHAAGPDSSAGPTP